MKYLILPMQPTPNGRMHIGHGGGTYLRADVLARSLRLEGHEVRMVCGSDAYENWILAAAAAEGLSPQETCAKFHTAIHDDLSLLDIEFDLWIDPLGDTHGDAYRQLHTDLFGEVRDAGTAATEEEPIPYACDDGRALIGTFIAGDCPNCGAAAGGSSCTACGEHFQPSQLLHPHARLSGSPIEWRAQDNWFLRPSSPEALLEALAASGVGSDHIVIAARYLERSAGRIRLSGPGEWGITSPLLPAGQILSNSYFLYCLYASRCVPDLGVAEPFAADSEVVTVGVFGSDNSTPGLIVPGVFAQATKGRLRPFSHTVVNGMLDLDGQKCSTSKRHGIWLGEALGGGLLTADELRYALAGVPVDQGRANLDLPDLVNTVNDFRALVAERIVPILDEITATRAEGMSESRLLEHQRQYLQPAMLDLPAARAVMREHAGGAVTHDANWAETLAWLAAPITPNLASYVWGRLGRVPVEFRGRPVADLDRVVRPSDLALSRLAALVYRAAT